MRQGISPNRDDASVALVRLGVRPLVRDPFYTTDPVATGLGLAVADNLVSTALGGKMTIEGKTIDPDDLSSEKIRKFDDAKISKYIYEGIEDEGMPAFKDLLSEAQIREIVRYVRVDVQKMSGGETAPPGAKK